VNTTLFVAAMTARMEAGAAQDRQVALSELTLRYPALAESYREFLEEFFDHAYRQACIRFTAALLEQLPR
jgi:hypothetical protein